MTDMTLGFIRTETDGRIAGVCNKASHHNTQIFLNESLVRTTLDGGAADSVEDKPNFRVPFRFRLTDFNARLNLSGQGSRTTAWTSPVLPPSVNSKRTGTRIWRLKELQRKVTVDCQVLYVVTAMVSVGKRQISSTSLEFFYVPVLSTRTPITIHEDLNDYTLSEQQAIKPRLSFTSKSLREVQIRAEMPSPIMINMLDRTGSTTVNFTITTTGLDLESVPVKCHVHACLVSTLLITPMWQEDRAPTLDECRRSSSSKIHEATSHPQGCILPIKNWKCATAEEYTNTHSRSNVATMTFRFVVDGDLPCPTFLTPLVSKRYGLITVVSFRNTRGRAFLRLSLPLQIAYNDPNPPCGDTR